MHLATRSRIAWIIEGAVVYGVMTLASLIRDPSWLRLILLFSGLLSIDLWERQALYLLEKLCEFKRPKLAGAALYLGFILAAFGRREIWTSFWALQALLLIEYAAIYTYIVIKHIETARKQKFAKPDEN